MGLDSARAGRRVAGLAILCVYLPLAAGGQVLSSGGILGSGSTPNGTSGSSGTGSTPTVTVRTVQGRVINALDGAGLPRVLVTLNARTVLSDSQGHFEFPGFTDPEALVTLTKPGFSQTNDAISGISRQRLPNLDAAAELKMYPDAVITGIVTGRDGLPLSQIQVYLRHATFGPSGMTWQTMRSASTNLRGEYRFKQPPGRYQVGVNYTPRARDTGEAVLPVQFPANSGSDSSSYFVVSTGEERHIDLRPRTGATFPVQIKVEPAEGRGGFQVFAVTSGGLGFQVPGGGGPGGFQVSLPVGSYTLRVTMNDRDTTLTGSTKVTVTGKQTDAATIHLEPAVSLPIELALSMNLATAATGSGVTSGEVQQPPTPQQFNLRLHDVAAVSGMVPEQDIMPRQRVDKTFEFRVPPGKYRLEALSGGGAWYIESATYGVTNLVTSEITVGSGAAQAPVRLVVNNQMGMVKVTPENVPATTETVWVYAIPAAPMLGTINPLQMNLMNVSSGTGSIGTRVPAGQYTVVAFDHRVMEDLRNPEVVAKLGTRTKTVEVTAAATATVAVEISDDPGMAK